MAQYSFTTAFSIASPRENVWIVLINFAEWQSWWKGVKKLEVKKEGSSPILAVSLGYFWYQLHLEFHLQHMQPENEILLVSTGDLVGTGKFTLDENNHQTTVHFYWDVATTKLWMNFTAPILRPFFEHSHHLVMKWFVHGLAKKLETKIISASYKTNHK